MTNEDAREQVRQRLDAASTELIALRAGKFTARERNRRIRKIKVEVKKLCCGGGRRR